MSMIKGGVGFLVRDDKGLCIGGGCYPIDQALSTEHTNLLAAKAGVSYTIQQSILPFSSFA